MKISDYIVQYKNGNVTVTLNTLDGTKERFTKDNEFHPEFAESIDVNISYRCDGNCSFCYASSTPNGAHADLLSPYVLDKFIPSLHPYTELALNGNDLSHPQLEEFLKLLKKQRVLANLTVNQIHFMENISLLHRYQEEKLIYGLGVSLRDSEDSKFLQEIENFQNLVVHTVAGILDEKDIERLKYRGIKLLILGYKDKGRGRVFLESKRNEISERIYYLRNLLPRIISESQFDIISFDNLAVPQLNVRSFVSEEDWNKYYMGDDGSFTFFVDLVNMKYARDSMTSDIHYIDNKDSSEMFTSIHK